MASAGEVLRTELLKRTSHDYLPWLDRQDAHRVVTDGLPEFRSEVFKYTHVGRWYEHALQAADDAPATVIEMEGHTPGETPDHVSVQNFDDEAARDLVNDRLGTSFDAARHPLAAVNRMLLSEGIVIHLRGEVSKPITVHHVHGAYQHILVIAEPNARATIIEHAHGYRHRIVECLLGENARIEHFRRQPASDHRTGDLVSARLEGGACYELSIAARGGELRRSDVHIGLAGEGATTTLQSAWRLSGKEHLDQQFTVSHLHPGGTSRQLFRGVAEDQAKGVLNGRIFIAPDAPRSDAELSTKNLLESTKAEIYAKPELEIHADDVRCAHGATIGALSKDALLYCQTRGIVDARALLLHGFVREALRAPPDMDADAWTP